MSTFRETLAEMLVAAGSNGLAQAQITARMQKVADAESLSEQLDLWWREGKVQRFTLPPKKKGGRPTKVWRATKIMITGSNKEKEND